MSGPSCTRVQIDSCGNTRLPAIAFGAAILFSDNACAYTSRVSFDVECRNSSYQSLAFCAQEVSRFFERPEYLNVTAVQHLVHARDSEIQILVDYDCASRPL